MIFTYRAEVSQDTWDTLDTCDVVIYSHALKEVHSVQDTWDPPDTHDIVVYNIIMLKYYVSLDVSCT